MGRRDKKVNEHSKGLLKGTIVGVIVGGIAALLLAPKSGKETQDDIKLRAKKMAKDSNIRMVEVQAELDGRIDNLKVAARNLRGDAYEESQRLITRAEVIKNDLRDSADRLATSSKVAKQGASIDAKRLITEGQAVLDELARATKKIMSTAVDTATKQPDTDGRKSQD